jgi:hypothetical protein
MAAPADAMKMMVIHEMIRYRFMLAAGGEIA